MANATKKYLFLSLPVTPAWGGAPATPTGVSQRRPPASPSFLQGSPSGRRTRTQPAPRPRSPLGTARRPGILWGWGHLVSPHARNHLILSLPWRKPVPSLVESPGATPVSQTGRDPPTPTRPPQRRALTELLCQPNPAQLGSSSSALPEVLAWPCGPVAPWPCGRAGAPSAAPPSAGPARSPSAPPPPVTPPPPACPPQPLPRQPPQSRELLAGALQDT